MEKSWSDKYKRSIDCDNPKGFSQRAHCQGKKKKMKEESNPRIPRKKGQPANSKKHSDLYTDENPKGTIHGLGFKDVETAKASVSKIRNSSRSHAHKIQAAVAMEQRAREMGKTSEAAVYRKYINSMKKKTKAMNEEKKGDHEHEMIRRQTDNIMVAAKKIKRKVGDSEGDVKAWVQSKITKAADYLDTAADYMTDKEEVKEGSLHKWFKGSKSKDGKGGWVNVVTGGTCASDEPGEGTPKCVSSAKRASMSKKERLSAARRKKAADPGQQQKTGAAKPTYVSTDPKKKMKESKEHPKNVKGIAKELDKAVEMHKSQAKRLRKAGVSEETVVEEKDKKGKGSGKKDACYHKVKSRYSVWPSAYASGALVKCRKKGAANWGNSTKKEEFLALPEFTEAQIKAMEANGIEVEVVEDCWDGYEKKGMKTMFGKRYPNCVKKKKTRKEEIEHLEETQSEKDRIFERLTLGEGIERIPSETGKVYLVSFLWRGKFMMMKLFFPELKQPNKQQVQSAMNKVYPGSKVMRFDASMLDNKDTYIRIPDMSEETKIDEKIEEAAAWTKKSGKNESGGLNEKGRKSYERENPGSDLKRPSKKVGNPRRKSFCARMKGMKKKLTSSKTANDPNSRINKSLRAWNC